MQLRGVSFLDCIKAMNTNTDTNTDTDTNVDTDVDTNVSARVQAYTFDNNALSFVIDWERVAREGIEIKGEYNTTAFDAMGGMTLKTLIHRTASRPKGDGEDATDWLLDALQGSGASGRFRVTSEDKERAATAMKGFKLAPEQTKKQFADRYGVAFQNNAEWLAKHYMAVRAAMAKAAKEAKSMI